MKYLKLNLKNPEQEVLEEILLFLKKGKVVALPTDTIYGLSCLATSSAAIKKIAAIKNRPFNGARHYLMLVSSVTQAKKYVFINNRRNETWSRLRKKRRPVTVMLPSRKLLSRELEANREVLSLRLPASDFLRKIVKLSGVPLVSTSFNLHGQNPFSDMTAAYIFFKNKSVKPDLIIDGGLPRSIKPSSLVDLSGDKEVILRK
ncbi:MAG: L-threonylcarbamoyladenylate synthase [Candidatus Falkowbacteria bacterium]|nr:L-threonylcarbamoyladenylate synthase [Candidatus Falkowbacteria bacterium]